MSCHNSANMNSAGVDKSTSKPLTTTKVDMENEEISSKPQLSKKAMKKELRLKRLQQAMRAKRERERDKRRERRRVEGRSDRRCVKTSSETRGEVKDRNLRVTVHMGFTSLMSMKEQCSLAGQVRRMYGLTRDYMNELKCSLLLTDVSDQVLRLLRSKNDGFDNWTNVRSTSASIMEAFDEQDRENLLYLSPDAEEVLGLDDLDTTKEESSSKILVIGGLVDDSIQKRRSLHFATENNIQCRRLPIKEHCYRNNEGANDHFKLVLTLNQVLEAVLEAAKSRSWSKALKKALPLRCGYRVFEEHHEDLKEQK